MIEGLFNRPPEDDAIPVLTEIIAPATDAAPAPDLHEIAEEAKREFRADPMSIDFAAELIPMPADAPAEVTEMPFPPAAIAHQTQLPPAVTVPYVEPTPDPTLPPPPGEAPTAAPEAAAAPASAAPTFVAPFMAAPANVVRAEAPMPGQEIPVLTSSLASGLPPSAAPVTQTQRLALLPDMDLIALEERLRDSVLARLHPRIDPMLDDRIENAVRETLDAALPVLRDQLHATLTETLQDVVSRAISKELAKIYSARAQKN